jgi:hypothetical protein
MKNIWSLLSALFFPLFRFLLTSCIFLPDPAAAGPNGSTPSGSRNLDGTPSVGGGCKTPRPCPRLLIFNPFGGSDESVET